MKDILKKYKIQFKLLLALTIGLIVLSSTDHKLSSGVKWFPKEIFGDYVFYASSLDEAYEVAKKKLIDNSLTYKLPKYFEENYYCKLKEKLEE